MYKQNKKGRRQAEFDKLVTELGREAAKTRFRERSTILKQQEQLREASMKEAMKNGQKIIVECSLTDWHSDKEVRSLVTQISFMVGAMRASQHPFQLIVANANGPLSAHFHALIDQRNGQKWPIKWLEGDFVPAKEEKIVVLSPDSDSVLQVFDSAVTYIVGGIVDRYQRQNETLDYAMERGYESARLPIAEALTQQQRKGIVLNLDSAFKILLSRPRTLEEWRHAFIGSGGTGTGAGTVNNNNDDGSADDSNDGRGEGAIPGRKLRFYHLLRQTRDKHEK